MASDRSSIAWLGHSTTLVELDGVRLLTDPLLRGRAAHLRRTAPDLDAALPPIDAVLISHIHWDHLDVPSLVLLGRDVPVLVPRGAGKLLTRRGFRTVTEVGVGEEAAVGAVTVRATHAEHDAGRGWLGVRAPALGYVVAGSRTVYFAGDTDRFDGMSSLEPELDVALLPIAGWGPRVPEGHLNAEGAAETLPLLRPRLAIPIHWATFAPFYRSRSYDLDAGERFAARARVVAPEVEVRVLEVGASCPI
jgi:L-ascorbate metabolism protein UlaG (beta-lactamase superfamily)